jgi:isopropylmalate/homocitrate/citramalate synthase
MPDIHICEVGPRDGLQNAKHLMATERWPTPG